MFTTGRSAFDERHVDGSGLCPIQILPALQDIVRGVVSVRQPELRRRMIAQVNEEGVAAGGRTVAGAADNGSRNRSRRARGQLN